MHRKLVHVAILLGGLAAACGGASTKTGDGSEMSDGAAMQSAGGEANGSPATDEQDLATYCAESKCPSTPEDVTTYCKECPVASEGENSGCTPNIFGGTRRYSSSCGGISVEVHYGFDQTVWHFNQEGQLIGVTWGSDTSSSNHGQQCAPTGAAIDLCPPAGNGSGGS